MSRIRVKKRNGMSAASSAISRQLRCLLNSLCGHREVAAASARGQMT